MSWARRTLGAAFLVVLALLLVSRVEAPVPPESIESPGATATRRAERTTTGSARGETPSSGPVETPIPRAVIEGTRLLLEGRLVALDTGLPLWGAGVRLSGSPPGEWVRTGADGKFRFAVDGALAGRRLGLSFEPPEWTGSRYMPMRHFNFEPWDGREGHVDYGDLYMRTGLRDRRH